MKVTFHDIGEGIHEAEVIQIYVKNGDFVKTDQPLIEVQTDKMTAEIPSPSEGMVQTVDIKVGDVIEVGQMLLTLETSEEGNERSESRSAKDTIDLKVQGKRSSYSFKMDSSRSQTTAKQLDQPSPQGPKRVLAAPHTRKLAREAGLDLEAIEGTGRLGRITDADIEATLQNQQSLRKSEEKALSTSPSLISLQEGEKPFNQDGQELPFRGRRKAIAKKMTQSLYTIPHVTHFDEADVTNLLEQRNQLKRLDPDGDKGYRVSIAAFFIKAVALALKDFPIFNAQLDEEAEVIRLSKAVHIGIATETEDGLIVPVIKNIESKSIKRIHLEMKDFIQRAQQNQLKPSEITGSTFTISNVGPLGSTGATPIINYPEVGLLAFHKTKKCAVVNDRDEIVVRSMMNLSMSFDHRVADGATAVAFTNKVIAYIEHPELLNLDLI